MGLRIQYEQGDDAWERVGDIYLPRRFSIEFVPPPDSEEPGWSLWFEVRDGAPACIRVSVAAIEGGREVRTSDLRAIRIQDLLVDAATNVGAKQVEADGGQVTIVRDLRIGRGARGEVRRAARRTITPALLSEVADVYRRNVESNPTQAVADFLGDDTTPRLARLYVKRARDAGILGPAIQGKAGEAKNG